VLKSIGESIVGGDYPEGTVLDPLAIMEAFGVSRTLVREVFKVLESKGLIEARPKIGTTVTARSQWKLLDEHVMGWRAISGTDRQLLLELEEIRFIIEPVCSRLCAERANDGQVQSIWEAAERIEKAEVANNIHEIIEADLRFHQQILAGGGNELLEKFEVLLEPALRARNRLNLAQAHSRKFVENHLEVARAIRNREGTVAEEKMRALLGEASLDTQSIVGSE
jgi:DNA-binding FadR family transcriptional regulator